MTEKDRGLLIYHNLLLQKMSKYFTEEEKLKIIDEFPHNDFNEIEVLMKLNVDSFTDKYLKDKRIGIQTAIAKLGREKDLDHFSRAREDIITVYLLNVDKEIIKKYVDKIIEKPPFEMTDWFIKFLIQKTDDIHYKKILTQYLY